MTLKAAGISRGDAVLDAEVKLGEIFAELQKADKGNQYTGKMVGSSDGTKLETIRSLGFTDPKKTAHRFELLAKHKSVVERVAVLLLL